MAGGLFSRIKNWIAGDNILFSDLNAEFNNIITNLRASLLDGYSHTVGEMQTTLNPGNVGTEVLPANIAQEISELRFQIEAITGGAQWYVPPVNSISNIQTLISGVVNVPANRVVSGRKDANNQPMFLVPNGSAPTVSLKATSTNLAVFINATSYTYSADIDLTGLAVATGSNNTCLVNDVSLIGQQSSKVQGERGSVITIDTIGSAISALKGTYQAFKTSTEIFIAEVDTDNNRLKNAFRGYFFDHSDASLARVALHDDDTITLLKLGWVFGTYGASTAGLDITYNKPTVSYTAPSSPVSGDYWLDLSLTQWKKFNGTSWAANTSILLGVCAMDTTNCIAARSFDFYKAFNIRNTMELEFVDTSTYRTTRLGQEVSVYGNFYSFDQTHVYFSSATDLDSGTTKTASTTFYAYITDTGNKFISFIAPYQRKFDLLGDYHPSKPWRCIGEFQTDGGSLFTSASLNIFPYHQETLPSSFADNSTIQISSTGFALKPNGVTRAYLSALGQQVSSSSANFETQSGTLTDVTNLSVTITSTGRPIFVALMSDGNGTNASFLGVRRVTNANPDPQAFFIIKRGSTEISRVTMEIEATANPALVSGVPPGSLWHLDVVTAGTYTYKVQAAVTTAGSDIARCFYSVLLAFEF